jgi:hypothetical protein
MNAQTNFPHYLENSHTTRSARIEQHVQRIQCANCDIDILWPAVIVQGHSYCCTGCAAGGPCTCDYSLYRSVNVSGVIHYGTEQGAGQEQ